MAASPVWFKQIRFSTACAVNRIHKNKLPSLPGCYVFTAGRGALVPDKVLYVGKAIDLRNRLRGYLVNYMETAATTHKGRAFLFEYRYKFGDGKLFLRWTIYGDPNTLEASLIDYLNPMFNDRTEPDGFADEEGVDRRFTDW